MMWVREEQDGEKEGRKNSLHISAMGNCELTSPPSALSLNRRPFFFFFLFFSFPAGEWGRGGDNDFVIGAGFRERGPWNYSCPGWGKYRIDIYVCTKRRRSIWPHVRGNYACVSVSCTPVDSLDIRSPSPPPLSLHMYLHSQSQLKENESCSRIRSGGASTLRT